jgi:uncharacterized membrane protein YdfJ with MMPL/SSD domain
VIAISTEFSVLLSARYRNERAAGASPEEALELTYASTGAAVLASGATAIAGFAALIASDVRMLQQFGIVTVIDLTVSLLGVMVVLPAALVWAEERRGVQRSDLSPRRLVRSGRDALADAAGDLSFGLPGSRPATVRTEGGPLATRRRPRLGRPRLGRPGLPRIPRPRIPRPARRGNRA